MFGKCILWHAVGCFFWGGFLATWDSYRSITSSFRVGTLTVSGIPTAVVSVWMVNMLCWSPLPPTLEFFLITSEPEPIVLLAVVDPNYRFRVIDVRGCGRTSDVDLTCWPVFTSSWAPRTSAWLCGWWSFSTLQKGHEVIPWIILPRERRIFNYYLSRGWLLVQNVFAILAPQWRMDHRGSSRSDGDGCEGEPDT